MAKRMKCPREGTKVVFKPNPASAMMYSREYGLPAVGETGAVTTVPLPGGRKTCMPGPGGGLVYVKWANGSTMGVSSYDIERAKRGGLNGVRTSPDRFYEGTMMMLVGGERHPQKVYTYESTKALYDVRVDQVTGEFRFVTNNRPSERGPHHDIIIRHFSLPGPVAGLGAYNPEGDQRVAYQVARARIADRNNTFLDIMRGPNPLSPEEVDRLIERHPGRYDAYRAWGAKARGLGCDCPGLGSVEDGLDDFEARDLLYQWHGGGGSGVYQVASMMDRGVPPGAYERARGELAQVRNQAQAAQARGTRYGTTGQTSIAELDALIAWLDEKILAETGDNHSRWTGPHDEE